MRCIILGVNTTNKWKSKPLSNVVLTYAKAERDAKGRGMRDVLISFTEDFKKARNKFFKELDRHCTNQEYVDFVNKFLKERTLGLETSEERLARRLAV